MIRSGRVEELTIAPQQTGTVKLNYNLEGICPEAEILLNVTYKLKNAETLLPAGYTVAKDQLVITPYKAAPLQIANEVKPNLPIVTPVVKENDYHYLIIDGEDFRIEFNKHNGYLCRYEVAGKALLNDGGALTPNFWRAPTDNDYGAGLQHKYAAWKNPRLKLTSLTHTVENKQLVVKAAYEIEAVSAQLDMTYTINNKGLFR